MDKVHIVFRQNQVCPSSNEFIGVFFDWNSAATFIVERPDPEKYFIETYDKPKPGEKYEVFA
jgi:hypothetical protein